MVFNVFPSGYFNFSTIFPENFHGAVSGLQLPPPKSPPLALVVAGAPKENALVVAVVFAPNPPNPPNPDAVVVAGFAPNPNVVAAVVVAAAPKIEAVPEGFVVAAAPKENAIAKRSCSNRTWRGFFTGFHLPDLINIKAYRKGR